MEKRDLKNRILKKGESQYKQGKRKGLYVFRYNDEDGNVKSLHSWKLVETDLMPKGKRSSKALRTLEEEIKVESISAVCNQQYTLNEIFQRRMSLNKPRPKSSTKEGYKSQYNLYVKDEIGSIPIDRLTKRHIENLSNNMYSQGLSTGTVDRIIRIVSGTCSYAVSLKIIDENVCKDVATGEMNIEKKVHALTKEQQYKLKEYVSNNMKFSYWKNLIVVLLGTGMRISEAAGLTWQEVDFENNFIEIKRGLVVFNDEDGKERKQINTPKSKKGIRKIPMIKEVKDTLMAMHEEYLNNEKLRRVEFMGVTGFVFLNRKNNVLNRNNFARVMRTIRKCYNDSEFEISIKEKREPEYMPECGAHVLRHTFATRLCEVENRLNVIQDICGHENIKTTLDIYAEVHSEVKQECVANLDALNVYGSHISA